MGDKIKHMQRMSVIRLKKKREAKGKKKTLITVSK